jgi:hypothetical protein
MAQFNAMPIGDPHVAGAKLGEAVGYKEIEVLKLARHLQTHAEMYKMPLPPQMYDVPLENAPTNPIIKATAQDSNQQKKSVN